MSLKKLVQYIDLRSFWSDAFNVLTAYLLFWHIKRNGLSEHIKEQRLFRIAQCSDCVQQGSCVGCGRCEFPTDFDSNFAGKELQMLPCSMNRYPRMYYREKAYKQAVSEGVFSEFQEANQKAKNKTTSATL